MSTSVAAPHRRAVNDSAPNDAESPASSRPDSSTVPTMEAPSPRTAPTYLGIFLFKLGKGLFFLIIALCIYTLSDNNLPEEFRAMVRRLSFDPEAAFFRSIAVKLGKITESNMLVVAGGTVLYALLALVEAVGLGMRKPWAGYLAIAESTFFIPIEIYDLWRGFSVGISALLIINLVIVIYLYRNRKRLFRH